MEMASFLVVDIFRKDAPRKNVVYMEVAGSVENNSWVMGYL